MSAKGRLLLSGLAWTAPWWLGFLLFLAVPMGISLYISLCDYPLLQPPVYVGAANYEALAADPVFHKVVLNTLKYALLAIPIGTALAIALAVLLNSRVRGQGFFRACVFVPTIVPVVATGVMWLWLLTRSSGWSTCSSPS
jgi:multiple sugar transport system permease protein